MHVADDTSLLFSDETGSEAGESVVSDVTVTGDADNTHVKEWDRRDRNVDEGRGYGIQRVSAYILNLHRMSSRLLNVNPFNVELVQHDQVDYRDRLPQAGRTKHKWERYQLFLITNSISVLLISWLWSGNVRKAKLKSPLKKLFVPIRTVRKYNLTGYKHNLINFLWVLNDDWGTVEGWTASHALWVPRARVVSRLSVHWSVM